jgi:long-chain acyl-CoA synthetase
MNTELMPSLAHLLINTQQTFPDKVIYQEKENGVYKDFTSTQIHDEAFALAKSFIKSGLNPLDKIAIISNNCLKWALTDYGALSAGLTDVPIYPTLMPDTIEFIINNSESQMIFVQDDVQLEKILSIDANNIPIKTIVTFNNMTHDDERVITYDAFKEIGKDLSDDEVNTRLDGIDNENLATLIYTSGTTGMPKGVMLSHENILHNIKYSLKALPLSGKDQFLSFLPLSHIFERMVGHYLPMWLGACIAFAESIETVAANMGEVKPTVMASVPRLYEKMHARVLENVELGSPIKQKIFHWAVRTGKDVANNYTVYGKKPSGMLAIKFGLASKLVFGKIKDRVGGRLRFFVSGGGALRADIAEFFTAAGLLILEGYGLTETSPVISCNRFERMKFGKVGLVLDDIECKIADDGEILTRSKSVMMGYYKNEEATKKAIDEDGWFYTGDIGEFDEDNFLKITDRKKDILVTSGGKNVAPLPIESALVSSKYIDQAVMIGDARKFCSAIIVAAEETVLEYCKKAQINGNIHDVCQNEVIQNLLWNEVEKVNKTLASYETVKKIVILSKPFTIESGELTPKMSIKKKIVLENNKEKIEKLYEE